ncbi:PREDICTED: uncharacterized protein LOC105559674 [Vollenhovia emeryi]|uniref:uncharacterized protein LOC105559674 n=1 Tax=Vollenhovia emeryi TaxID=411798 RepID=UPI0005F42CA7|nr:PREDICTED: uncharacterized protein LOC105559674 [Vollenhovia emeryi]
MICIETQYLGLNRILLLAVGLWPFQQSKFTRFQFSFLFAILMTSIIFQLTAFITTLQYTSDFIARVLFSATFFTIFMIIYYAFYVNIEIVKTLLIQLQHVCDELTDKNEIAIVEKYGYTAKCYTIALIVAGICAVSGTFIVQLWIIYDDVLSMNVTRSHSMLYVTEYFVDQEKYFFLILLHINLAECIGAIAMVATGTMFITYFEIFCGMFKISSYRIERAVKINIVQNMTLRNKMLRSVNLICAIDIHRQVIKLCKHFLSTFEIMFFCLAQMFVISLCFNFVRISQILLYEQTTKKAILPTIFVAANILYLFLANFYGQTMTDHNNYIFNTVYNVEWYATPLHIQKLILFLLLKGAKNFTLNVGGLFITSLECFATLVKASVSYFTVVLATQ